MRVRGCARSPNRIRRLTLEPPPTAGRSGGRVGKAAAPTAASRLTCGRGVRCGCVFSVGYPDSQRLVRRDRRSGLRPSAKSARRACEGAFTRARSALDRGRGRGRAAIGGTRHPAPGGLGNVSTASDARTADAFSARSKLRRRVWLIPTTILEAPSTMRPTSPCSHRKQA